MEETLRLNMTDLSTKIEDNPAEWAAVGDRGLVFTNKTAQHFPTCHPLETHDTFAVTPALFPGLPSIGFGCLRFGVNVSSRLLPCSRFENPISDGMAVEDRWRCFGGNVTGVM